MPIAPASVPHVDVDGTHALPDAGSRAACEDARAALDALPDAWRREAERGLDGDLAFLVPGGGTGVAGEIEAYAAASPPRATLLVVGIGGSALSARCFAALRDRFERSRDLVVLDTADPDAVAHLVATRDPHAIRLLGVSKSGATLESTAVFGVLEAWLRDVLGESGARDAIAVVAGDGSNPLRALAMSRGYRCFDLAARIGGRFSGLTAVGMLPAAFCDVDPRALEAGARFGRDLVLRPAAVNPALELAALQHAAWLVGRRVHVLMPYGERLAPLGPWWAQLLGESLGKIGRNGPVGPVALAARGPADQHSLLQRLLDGPDDSVVVTIDAPPGERPADAAAARAHRALAPIQDACLHATQAALRSCQRPVLRIRLGKADPFHVAALFVVAEAATVAWARLLGVDPQGQPGVQRIKDAAAERLGPRDPFGQNGMSSASP